MPAEVVRLGVVAADGTLRAGDVRDIPRPIGPSLRWSADGAELAMLGRVDAAAGTLRHIFRYRLADGRLRCETDSGLDSASVVWAGDGSILTFARETQTSERSDWWLLAYEAEPRNLSAELDAVPTRLFPEEGRQTFVGLGREGVLRLSLKSGAWVNLTEDFGRNICELVWPSPDECDRRSIARLVLAVDGATSSERFSLELLVTDPDAALESNFMPRRAALSRRRWRAARRSSVGPRRGCRAGGLMCRLLFSSAPGATCAAALCRRGRPAGPEPSAGGHASRSALASAVRVR